MTTESTNFVENITVVHADWLNAVDASIFDDVVNPKRYGAVGDGVTDDTAAITAAFAAGKKIVFPSGTYLMTSGVTKAADNVEVDFGDAVFLLDFGGAGTAFVFGTRSDTPLFSNLLIKGGKFTLNNPSGTDDNPCISIEGTKNFTIRGVTVNNACNGAIRVFAGCADGTIEDCNIYDASGGATVRGIWLDGSSASDYVSQLVDLSTITRNATALPVYGVKNITIKGNTLILPAYGIYLDNTQDCRIQDNYIDISGVGASRCIALNNYSARATICGNILKCDRAATGILITQYSTGVKVADNEFVGDFGSGRDIYVQYLAEALISDNRFTTDSTQRIEINMGGIATVQNNYFDVYTTYTANERVVNIYTIDSGVAAGTGDTATTLPGLVFKDNVIHNICVGVLFDTQTSSGGRIPGLDNIVVRDNVFYNFDSASGAGEYLINGTANGSTYIVKLSCFGNIVYPEAYAYRNTMAIGGSGYSVIRQDSQRGCFRITNATGGGAVTSVKQDGGYFSCDASRSGDEMLISPRTIAGATNTAVARVVGIVPVSSTIYSWKVHVSGSNYLISLYDSSDVAIALSTTAATFDVIMESTAT